MSDLFYGFLFYFVFLIVLQFSFEKLRSAMEVKFFLLSTTKKEAYFFNFIILKLDFFETGIFSNFFSLG